MISIFIDESGSFVPAENEGSWNVSAALVIPNPRLRQCKEALKTLKLSCGAKYNDEIKLKNVTEQSYLEFLTKLNSTDCILHAVATDAGLQTTKDLEAHRNGQADKVEEHKAKMFYPEGTLALEKLADQIRALSAQLHLQLVCQVELIADVVSKSVLYYVQRLPRQLNAFRWRIDEKTSGISNFEKTFETLLPPILQAKSLEKPDIHVTDFDYSAMEHYFYTPETKPTYLEECYGFETSSGPPINLGKLVWGDFEFVDSKLELGVQIADLLVSGMRRSLRGEFTNGGAIAEALGRLMVQSIYEEYPVQLVTLSHNEAIASEAAIKASNTFKKFAKKLLV